MQPNEIENLRLDDQVEVLRPVFPRLNASEQNVSLQIYRLLVQGRPLERKYIADRLQMPLESINKILNRWWGIHYDQQDRIVAYWGLSLQPTQHRFEVAGRTMYTWCAWDTLFLPEILMVSPQVESFCATTQSRIRLRLAQNRIEKVEPDNVMISFMAPDATRVKENLVNHFCCLVHFFKSEDAGRLWTERHPGTFLLPLEQAHTLGRKINAIQYPKVYG